MDQNEGTKYCCDYEDTTALNVLENTTVSEVSEEIFEVMIELVKDETTIASGNYCLRVITSGHISAADIHISVGMDVHIEADIHISADMDVHINADMFDILIKIRISAKKNE